MCYLINIKMLNFLNSSILLEISLLYFFPRMQVCFLLSISDPISPIRLTCDSCTGLPWWQVIAITTVILRSLVIPLNIMAIRNMTIMNNNQVRGEENDDY